MKYLSLFSGVGGFELGIGNKAECIGYSEIDKYAISIYEKHFPEHKNYGDITKINSKELPDFDILVGGFPCQSFSIAGKRGGFNDTRGTLFFEICRLLKEKKPRLVLLENVKGLLSHDEGRTFRTIISTLDELGYDLQWQVLNSKNFGVPQNRERVFIIGHSRRTTRPQVFPFTENGRANFEGNFGIIDGYNRSYTKEIGTVRQNMGNGGSLIQLNNPKHSNDRVYEAKGISPTLNTMQGGMRQPKIANTIDANYYKGMNRNKGHASSNRGYEINGMIRRLTPIECERLQGFPDNWTQGISDTQRYKCLGNAVTVNVIQAIVDKLLFL